MTVAASGTFGTVARASVSGFSKSIPASIQVNVRGLTNTEAGNGSVAWGKSATRPTTFAGLANPEVHPLSDISQWTGSSATTNDGGTTYSVNLSNVNTTLANAAWAPGDLVWLAIFASASPAGGDVPLATAGPFTVLA